jgi:regulator of cell morphogenesis and NO signaling
MENLLLSQTLAQIVNENHQAASVFEKYGLDFCCKGKRSLQIACDEKKLSVTDVTAELESVIGNETKPVIDFDKMSLTKLVGYIVATHHAYVKQEAPQILAYLQKVADKHGERHPELYKVLVAFTSLKEEMDSHMHKEEFILFPRIVELGTSDDRDINRISLNYLQAPMTMMEHEHEHAGKLLEEIKQHSAHYTPPEDACTTYRLAFAALRAFEMDLHQHIHLENNILFPKALELFRKTKEAALN